MKGDGNRTVERTIRHCVHEVKSKGAGGDATSRQCDSTILADSVSILVSLAITGSCGMLKSVSVLHKLFTRSAR